MEEKICPTCGAVNKISEMMCIRCMADISAVMPVKHMEVKKVLLKLKHNNEVLELSDKMILGRDNTWSGYLEQYRTVSRKHAVVSMKDEKWMIEDLGSTNGTYVNNDDIRGKGAVVIKAGDKIGLSKSFEVMVEEKA